MTPSLTEVFDRLFTRYGPQHWWPGRSPFEVMVGAVLVQNTAWRNVERAIENLRESGCLEPHTAYGLPGEELAELIRPAGYYRVKTKRLRNLLQLLIERFDGSVEAMSAVEPSQLRKLLLGVHGIGPETADAILLYAVGVPKFVVDAYAVRVLARHGWIESDADYDTVQDYFESRLPCEAPLFNEFHALLVRLGKECCKTTPQCAGCPLEDVLPECGPCSGD